MQEITPDLLVSSSRYMEPRLFCREKKMKAQSAIMLRVLRLLEKVRKIPRFSKTIIKSWNSSLFQGFFFNISPVLPCLFLIRATFIRSRVKIFFTTMTLHTQMGSTSQNNVQKKKKTLHLIIFIIFLLKLLKKIFFLLENDLKLTKTHRKHKVLFTFSQKLWNNLFFSEYKPKKLTLIPVFLCKLVFILL